MIPLTWVGVCRSQIYAKGQETSRIFSYQRLSRGHELLSGQVSVEENENIVEIWGTEM